MPLYWIPALCDDRGLHHCITPSDSAPRHVTLPTSSWKLHTTRFRSNSGTTILESRLKVTHKSGWVLWRNAPTLKFKRWQVQSKERPFIEALVKRSTSATRRRSLMWAVITNRWGLKGNFLFVNTQPTRLCLCLFHYGETLFLCAPLFDVKWTLHRQWLNCFDVNIVFFTENLSRNL